MRESTRKIRGRESFKDRFFWKQVLLGTKGLILTSQQSSLWGQLAVWCSDLWFSDGIAAVVGMPI
jgi:hypothetical protein